METNPTLYKEISPDRRRNAAVAATAKIPSPLSFVAALLLLLAGLLGASGVDAASLEFVPSTIQVESGQSQTVELRVTGVPASGLAAYQFDLVFDPASVQINDPNGGLTTPYVPLGNNPLCDAIRGETCSDSDWMLITTGRAQINHVRAAAGRITVLYATSGAAAPPAGDGFIGLIEIQGVGVSNSTVSLEKALITDNGRPPRAHPLTLGSLDVQVITVNQPPTAVLQATDTGGTPLPGNRTPFGANFVLDGTASSDSDGTVVGYRWSNPGFSGGQILTASPTLTVTPALTGGIPLALGSHPFTLQVEDNSGNLSTPVQIDVVVFDGQAPTAVLQATDTGGTPLPGNQTPFGSDFVLDGSASIDSGGGSIDQYRWSNPSFGGVITTATPTLTVTPALTGGSPLPLGSHPFTLQVVDNSGNLSAPAQVNVIVFDDQAPTAVLQATDTGGTPLPGNQTPFAADFVLDGSASIDSGGGSIDQYRWSNPSFGGVITTATPTLTVTSALTGGSPLPLGLHTFGLQVVDDSGNLSALTQVAVIVFDDQAPTAVLQATDTGGAPLPGNQTPFGSDFVLDGSASIDSGGGSIDQYRWSNPSFGGVITTATPTLTVTAALTGGSPLPIGTHQFGLEVVDDSGNLSAQALINVIVIDGQVPTAVLRVTDTGGTPLPGNRSPFGADFVLDGSASSDSGGGSIDQYRWSNPVFVGGVITTATPTLTVTPALTGGSPLPLGVHTFGLQVVDDSGNLSALTQVAVIVFDDQAPTAVLQATDIFGTPLPGNRTPFGDDFVLDGSASSDSGGGSIVEYRWANPGFIGGEIVTATPTLTVTPAATGGSPLALGSHVFTLSVVDNSGNLSASVQTSVIVIDDQAPTAVLQATDTFGTPLPGNRTPFGDDFVLDGAASSDSGGGSVVEYRWSNPAFVGGEIVTGTPTLTVTPALTGGSPLPLGAHTFGLRVVDDSGNLSAPVQVDVIVFDDQAPTAVLQATDTGGTPLPADRTPFGTDFVLDGSASTDSGGGSIVEYRWSNASFTSPTIVTATPTLTVTPALTGGSPLPLGSHLFTLRVVDDSGNLSAQVQVNVVVFDDQAPTAVLQVTDIFATPLPGNQTPFGADFVLDGSSSIDSGGGTITQYRWSNPSFTGGLLTTPTPTLTVTPALTGGGPLPLGVHTFGLQVVDDSGNLSTTTQVDVIVFDDQAPTAVLQVTDTGGTPLPGNQVAFAQDFILDGSASIDTGGGIVAAYSWSGSAFVSGVVQTLTPTLNVAAHWSAPLPLGNHVFTLEVEDDSGNVSTPVQQIVTVIDTQAPVADAGSDYNLAQGAPAPLDGSNSYDPDGGLLSFDWSFVSLPAASALTDTAIADPTLAQTSFTPDVVGDFELELSVDDGVFQSADRIVISVFAGNVPPVADAGGDFDTTTGVGADLDAGGSYDPDSGPSALTYQWRLLEAPASSSLVDADIINSNQAQAQFIPDVEGGYRFEVTVSDGEDSGSDEVVVTATLANLPPTVDAGLDQTVTLGDTVFLNGSSGDPDNGPQSLSGQWSFVTLPGGSGLVDSDILGATTDTASFVPDIEGQFLLRYQVSDGEDIASDQVAIQVEQAAGSVPPAPQNLSGRGRRGRVSMAWDAVPDVLHYNVYKRSSLGSEFVLYATTPSTYALDVFVVGETTIDYYVTAVNDVGESDPSNIISVTPNSR